MNTWLIERGKVLVSLLPFDTSILTFSINSRGGVTRGANVRLFRTEPLEPIKLMLITSLLFVSSSTNDAFKEFLSAFS